VADNDYNDNNNAATTGPATHNAIEVVLDSSTTADHVVIRYNRKIIDAGPKAT